MLFHEHAGFSIHGNVSKGYFETIFMFGFTFMFGLLLCALLLNLKLKILRIRHIYMFIWHNNNTSCI